MEGAPNMHRPVPNAFDAIRPCAAAAHHKNPAEAGFKKSLLVGFFR